MGNLSFSGNTTGTRIRLARDLAQFNQMSEASDIERQQELMRDKKAKESIRKHQKERAIQKVNNLGVNAPLSKYYREQVQPL